MKATSIAIALSLGVTDGLLIAAAAKPSLVGRAPVGAVRMTTMKAAAAKVAAMRAVNDVDEPERSERAALNKSLSKTKSGQILFLPVTKLGKC